MNGGPSHVDTFDPKVALEKYHGQTAPTKNLRTERPTGNVLKSPYKFKQYGECGLPVSEIFSRTAEHMDDICVIRSMHADVPNHEPSLMLMNTGESRSGATKHGLMDFLRSGQRQRKSSILCHHVPWRISHQGIAELAERIFAWQVSSHLYRHKRTTSRRIDRSHPKQSSLRTRSTTTTGLAQRT